MGAGSTPAGWYPDVERAGGERYWDGSIWTEDRRGTGAMAPQSFGDAPPAYNPAPGQAAQPGVGQPPPQYGQPSGAYGSPQGYQAYGGFGRAYQKSSNAGVALGLSIAGLVCCGFLGIPGLIMGRKEMSDIDAGLIDPSNRGTAKAAFIIGVIVCSLMALAIVGYILLIAVAAGTSTV